MMEYFLMKVLYGSYSGTAEKYAKSLLSQNKHELTVHNLQDYDPEDLANEEFCVFIISTYQDGNAPPSAQFFVDWIKEATVDFRVDHGFLSKLSFAVFGLGDSYYADNYNKAAKSLSADLVKLGAKKVYSGVGDSSNDSQNSFKSFCLQLDQILSLKAPVIEDSVMDMEDLGNMLEKIPTESSEMVTTTIRNSLTKQGYKIIGTHSGVKVCRWTKSMLRGRGGCYKYRFVTQAYILRH